MPAIMQAMVGGGFRPEVGGSFHVHRFKALELVNQLGLQPGDICCRLGGAVARQRIGQPVQVPGLDDQVSLYAEIPFSPLIARVSASEYSHAGLVYEVGPMNWFDILDVGSDGTKVLRLLDWLDDVRGNSVIFLRYSGNLPHKTDLGMAMDKLAEQDPDFDSDFAPDAEKLYCVEGCVWCYAQVGIDLGPPVRFRDLPHWDWRLEIMAALGNIKPDTPVYVVGSKGSGIGLLASPYLKVVGKLVLTEEGVNLE